MRVQVVDPSAFTRPYDHALCSALSREGIDVELLTSRFAYGEAPDPDGYALQELFYRHAAGPPGSRMRVATKLLEHVPDMARLGRRARTADVVHFQWLDVQWLDPYLLPRRPTVLTAHDLLPREPRLGQARAQRRCYAAVDAVIAHSEYGRRVLVEDGGVNPAKVRVIHHGAFEHLTRRGDELALPDELRQVQDPVVLFFGLLRPYKGLDVLLDAWRSIDRAELWIVGRPRMALEPLRARAPDRVRFIPRFVSERELPAFFRRAEIVVLPYVRTQRLDQSGVLATALAFGKPLVVSDVGSFSELAEIGAARLVVPGDANALAYTIAALLSDPDERGRLAASAEAAAHGPYSWERAAEATAVLYGELAGHNPAP